MLKLYRLILLLLLLSPGLRLFCDVIVLKDASTEFFSLTKISDQEWTNALPEDGHSPCRPEVSYESELETSVFLYSRIVNRGSLSFWYLEFLDQLELAELHYFSPNSGTWNCFFAGDQVPMNERALPHNRLLLPLEIDRGESLELYIRVQDYQYKSDSLRIISPGAFLREAGLLDILDLFLFSLIIFMILYMLLRLYSSRRLYYLFYILVMCFLVVTLLGKYRYLSYLFLRERPYGYFVYLFFNSLAAIAALLFTWSFFEIKVKSPLFIIMSILAAGLAAIAVGAVFSPNPQLDDLMNMLIIPSLFLILFKGIRTGFSGDKASRVIIISFIPVLLGSVADNFLLYFEISRSNSPDRMMLAGTAVHIFLMNYGMAIRRAEREREYWVLKEQFTSRVEKSVKERTRKIELDASRDPLTGIMNRAAMEKKIAELEAFSVSSIGILFADMDNFKYYNDTYGHNAGDRILRETALFLIQHMRGHDLIYRYGGDEFLILMPETPSDQAGALGKRLHREFQKFAERVDHELNNDHPCLGLTLGFSDWKPGQSLRNAVDAADKAMIEAKRQGKNRLNLRPL